jgi:hypothetical protein
MSVQAVTGLLHLCSSSRVRYLLSLLAVSLLTQDQTLKLWDIRTMAGPDSAAVNTDIQVHSVHLQALVFAMCCTLQQSLCNSMLCSTLRTMC